MINQTSEANAGALEPTFAYAHSMPSFRSASSCSFATSIPAAIVLTCFIFVDPSL